jgi:hypothetical protein
VQLSIESVLPAEYVYLLYDRNHKRKRKSLKADLRRTQAQLAELKSKDEIRQMEEQLASAVPA